MAIRNLTVIGDTYGRLTVLSDAASHDKRRRVTAKCECGTTKDYALERLRAGKTKSCGCLIADSNRSRSIHQGAAGTRKTRPYRIWKSMLSRCSNPKVPNWVDYGGRGIKVCERWNSFENFLEDMGTPPDGMSLDRRDNDLGYFKENCRWATRIEQNNNARSNVYLDFNGRRLTVSQWAHELGFKVSTLHNRYQNGWSAEKILTTVAVIGRRKII